VLINNIHVLLVVGESGINIGRSYTVVPCGPSRTGMAQVVGKVTSEGTRRLPRVRLSISLALHIDYFRVPNAIGDDRQVMGAVLNLVQIVNTVHTAAVLPDNVRGGHGRQPARRTSRTVHLVVQKLMHGARAAFARGFP
jgi:hypothetical protein